MASPLLRRVVSYIWLPPDEEPFFIPALEWWPEVPGFEVFDGRRCIVIAPEFQPYREPDAETLECGHEQPIRKWNSRQYYNRRRICRSCAAGFGAVA